MTDLFTRIKTDVPPENYDLTTAEGRAAWDADLRGFIKREADDDSLRSHLGNMVKEWRFGVLNNGKREYQVYSLETGKAALDVLLKTAVKVALDEAVECAKADLGAHDELIGELLAIDPAAIVAKVKGEQA